VTAKEKPQRGGWGLGLGLPIFETKTHPVTTSIIIAEGSGSPGTRRNDCNNR
jgi:hypothetical protein